MSTIKVTTIQDTSGGNSSTSEQIAQGRAKAWVNFNGTGTVAIRDDFNVNSITDDGSVGSYTVNFTNAFADANYAALGLTGFGIYARTTTPQTASTFKVGTFDTRDASNEDRAYVYLVFYGD